MALLPIGVLAPGCSSDKTATKGQLITCTTDPGTGVILRCEPGGSGSGSGSGSGMNTCQDIDEDGDGNPHDEADDSTSHFAGPSASDGDSDDHDGDGIPDDRDCDEHPGEDGMEDGLPYDIRPKLGATVKPILDAFAERGGTVPEIVSVTMSGGTWRLTELQAGTAFVVTQADCDHAGNRSTGRDRVVVTWKNANQTQSSDHLDIRYCDSN
ncbi:MAG: hypothetical protein E6J90_28375 [Deltaproteobacteria bacterium]|nr:MAG: hypothetical protein E6J90_28375 [Deltaproteobacteria bacterium]